jgi:hypothetical protein
VADERYRLMPFPKVYAVKTTNAGFAKEFTVCSTHPGQAGSILTESFMNCMLKFKKQIERDISLSVVGGRCFVSIPINENLFEPSGDPGNKENIKEYFFEVLMVLSIINQLELYKLC